MNATLEPLVTERKEILAAIHALPLGQQFAEYDQLVAALADKNQAIREEDPTYFDAPPAVADITWSVQQYTTRHETVHASDIATRDEAAEIATRLKREGLSGVYFQPQWIPGWTVCAWIDRRHYFAVWRGDDQAEAQDAFRAAKSKYGLATIASHHVEDHRG